MKRLIILPILFAVIFALSSCGEPPTVQSDFTASFTANYDDVDYAGTVTKNGDNLTVTFSAPYTVEGTAFCYEDGTLCIRYAGHSTQANADYLPANSVPAMLHNTLSYLSQASYTGTQDGKDHFSLPTPYGDASFTAQDGIPLSLTAPQSGTVFLFEPCPS